jgi:hypothetical protein
MSEQDNQALNNQAEEDVSLPTTPVDEPKATEEVEEIVEPEVSESPEETTETEKKETNKGLNNRVRQLNEAKKLAETKAAGLEEKLSKLTEQDSSSGPTPVMGTEDYTQSLEEPVVTDGETLSVSELNQRIKAREQRLLRQASANAELNSRQTEVRNRVKTEASEAARRHPELDPESEHFNSDLSDTVTEAVWAMVRAEPYTASVNKLVDKLMKPYKGAVTKAVGEQSEELAKQASQGATRPTTVRKSDKPMEEKTIAELERDLGIVQS